MLVDSDLPPDQKGYVNRLDQYTVSLFTFIKDVSLYAKAVDGLIEPEGKPIPIKESIGL